MNSNLDPSAPLAAHLAAYARAYHTAHDAPCICCDPLARPLLGDAEYHRIGNLLADDRAVFAPELPDAPRSAVLAQIVHTLLAPAPLAMAAFTELALRAAVRTGVRQCVLLRAGLDTLALRRPDWMADCAVFELDPPAAQADKQRRIARAGLSVPPTLHFVPAESPDDLERPLRRAGFDPARKAVFVAPNASSPDADGFARLLAAVAALGIDGVELVLDYADAGLPFDDDPPVRRTVALAQACGAAVRAAFDPFTLEQLLASHGFRTYEHLDPDAVQAQYFAARRDGLTAAPHIGLVRAVWKAG